MVDFKPLRIALIAIGIIFVFGVFPLTMIWPAGWIWHSGGHSDYLQMILGIYATLGIFLLVASRNPLAHLSLIWFNGLVQRCARRNPRQLPCIHQQHLQTLPF